MKVPSEMKEICLNILTFLASLALVLGVIIGGMSLIKYAAYYIHKDMTTSSIGCEGLTVRECIEKESIPLEE
jgi:hypothetical protein